MGPAVRRGWHRLLITSPGHGDPVRPSLSIAVDRCRPPGRVVGFAGVQSGQPQSVDLSETARALRLQANSFSAK